jgi:hypothetical protein
MPNGLFPAPRNRANLSPCSPRTGPSVNSLPMPAGSDDAQIHLDASRALAQVCTVPYERALALLAMAELHTACGEPESAKPLLDGACTICMRLGAKPALARADALASKLTAVAKPARGYPGGLSAREGEYG